MTQASDHQAASVGSPKGGPSQFRRINPHAGLMIDANVWRDAHEYHREQLRLHHLALHGWGIVRGLDLRLVEGSDNTLQVDPGVAIDGGGNFVVVPQPQTYRIMSRETSTIYLVLQFREVPADPAPT